MDALDHLAAPAADLLDRVDRLLAGAGAPEGHRIWPLLRRLGALPGPAVGTVVALRPAPPAAAGSAVRRLIPLYDDARASLADRVDWRGAGAQAWQARRDALAAHLAGGPDTLLGRLDATAGYAEALADWVRDGRRQLARTLAEVLGSAEAVQVVTAPDAGSSAAGASSSALAAAEIGARVLASVAEFDERGQVLAQEWAPLLAELSLRGPARGAVRLDATTWVAG